MRNHFAPPTFEVALLTVFSTGAQTISPPAACSLSAQSAERRFEPTDVEFVKDPKALSPDRKKEVSRHKGSETRFFLC